MPAATVRRPGRRICRQVLAALAVMLAVAGCGAGHGERAAEPTPTGDPAVVQTASGAVRGVVAADHRIFAGIPYAAPPVGPLRWQPPAPEASWQGVRDAGRPGPRCIQDPGGDMEQGRNTSEDCLTLNVWTPPRSAQPRPVMVWIHGGAFVNGSGGIYDARRLAARGDIVVVTINYRLGTLGFLAHPGLGPAGRVGNYGLADQQAALRWVRDNIAGFGGDPAMVTIAGESAGGMSVCDHLVAPGSVGLFRAAIIQSAPCQAQIDLPTAQRRSLDYAAGVGCPDPATAARCLRDLPVDKLRKPVWYFGIGGETLTGPITGTEALPVDPVVAFARRDAARVPVLIGTTRDEFTLFAALRYLRDGDRFPASEYPQLLADTFGADAATVGERYPIDRYGGVAVAYSAAVTDGLFACQTDRMADDLSHVESVYAYEFDDRDAPAPGPLRELPFPVGASHSLELRYLFDMGGAPPLSPTQRELSDQMIAYWARFVSTGSPMVDGQPAWPALKDRDAGERMSFGSDGSRITRDFEDVHQCPFWAGLQR